MKKLISCILVFAALLALAVPAWATEREDAVIRGIEKSLENLDCENSVNRYGRVVTVEMWPNEINALIVLAKSGEDSAVAAWGKFTASIAKLQTAMQETFDENGFDNLVAIVNIYGDKVRDRILYSIVDGVVAVDAVTGETGQPAATPTPAPDPADDLTMGQKNAVRKAESYLSFISFSRAGLIKQLVHDGFTDEEAEFAVDSITVDWDEQAVKKAESYLSFMSFSRDRLIKQLVHDGFTDEQAEYAAVQVGY